jgi:hypothetical protein
VTSIGDYFLSYAKSLETFDTVGLCNVKKIGYRFLGASFYLHTFDMRGLTSLESAGSGFLYNNHRLETVNMQGLNSRATIAGNTANWMYERQKSCMPEYVKPTCFKLKGGTITVGQNHVFPIINGKGILNKNKESVDALKDLLHRYVNSLNKDTTVTDVYVSVDGVKGKRPQYDLVSYIKIPVSSLAHWKHDDSPKHRKDKIDVAVRMITNNIAFLKVLSSHNRISDFQKIYIPVDFMHIILSYHSFLCDQNLNKLDTKSMQPISLPAPVQQLPEEETKDNITIK